MAREALPFLFSPPQSDPFLISPPEARVPCLPPHSAAPSEDITILQLVSDFLWTGEGQFCRKAVLLWDTSSVQGWHSAGLYSEGEGSRGTRGLPWDGTPRHARLCLDAVGHPGTRVATVW